MTGYRQSEESARTPGHIMTICWHQLFIYIIARNHNTDSNAQHKLVSGKQVFKTFCNGYYSESRIAVHTMWSSKPTNVTDNNVRLLDKCTWVYFIKYSVYCILYIYMNFLTFNIVRAHIQRLRYAKLEGKTSSGTVLVRCPCWLSPKSGTGYHRLSPLC